MEIERGKKMNCTDTLKKILENGSTSDPGTLDHINTCPDCKTACDAWAKLAHIKTGVEKNIPQEIENAILDSAYDYAEKRNKKPFTFLRWSILSSAAACIVFSLTTILYLNLRENAPSAKAATPLQLIISQDEKWNSIDMTIELDNFKSEIDAHISELAPRQIIDMSSLIIKEHIKSLS